MNLVVCLTQVPDTAARLKIASDSQTIDSAGLSFVMNPYDEYALEEAVQIKEKVSGASVTVFSVGDGSFQPTIKKAFAMGADHAILLEQSTADSFGVANILANAIRSHFDNLPDLIFLGKEATDTNDAQVGAMLGELLQMPAVSVVTSFELDGTSAKLEREIEAGTERLEVDLPLIVTAQKGLNMPRQTNMKAMMLAKKKKIDVMDLAALGTSPDEVGSAQPKSEIVEFMKSETRQAGRKFEGDAADITAQVVNLLANEAKVL